MSALLVILVVAAAAAAVIFGVSTIWGGDEPAMNTIPEGTPTVRLEGEILMVSHNGLHHPVTAHVAATQGRKMIGSTQVLEDNTFVMDIPADARGEIEVALGLHGGSVSLAQADGGDLHVTIIYNPVNNYFA